MLSLIGVILIAAQMSAGQAMDINNDGMMDEIVVTAPRFGDEDIAYSGMLDPITVIAPRYYSEAEMGMMPEIVVTAPRASTVFNYAAIKGAAHKKGWTYQLLTIESMDHQTTVYPN